MATATQASPSSSTRLIGLDLLRLLAVLMVLGRHMEQPPSNWHSPLKPAFDAWYFGGGEGVDLFFVLSGFLVSGLLFSEYTKRGELSAKRFYIRRAWKIYPSFYVLYVVSYIYHYLEVGRRMGDRQAIGELLFVQSYIRGYWWHTWTLAVEEHFYLILPLLLAYFVRKSSGENPFRAVPRLVLGVSVACLAIRYVNFSVRTVYSPQKMLYHTHLRLDELFFGVGIAYYYHFHAAWFRRTFQRLRYVLVAAGVAMLTTLVWLPLPVGNRYICTIAVTQYYLGSAALLVGVLMCQIPSNRATMAVAALGMYSYPIYLWHMAVRLWGIPHLERLGLSWQVRTAVYFLSAFVVGIAMAKLVETPLLRLRDRWYPSRAEISQAAPHLLERHSTQLAA
jgi:peptidoglycan/LPS O-acetylase OafA/YrhL